MRRQTSLFALVLIGGALACAAACSDDELVCADVTAECAPLYEPTFDNIYTNTLQQRCDVPGTACHAREGAQGGLVFADIDESYELLTGQADGRVRVNSDELGCGVLLSRLGSTDPSWGMPPAAPLSDAELCAIVQWIENGAPR